MSANLSWMDRATRLHEQLGLSRRTPARIAPPPVAEDSTLVRDERTLTRDDPTLARDDPTLVNEEPTLEFRTDYVDEADISDVSDIDDVIAELARELDADAAEEVRDEELIGSETRPSEFDIPDFRPQRFARATLIGAVGAVIALAAAAAALHPLAKRGAPAARISATPKPQEPVPQPPPELRSPGPVPAPTTTSDGAIQTAPLELAPVEISRDEASSAAVTIKVIPSGAVIFRAGEKLGVGSVQVHVARAAKQRLTALHDGYLPYNFTVDGSRGSVTVRLKLAPRSPIADPAEQAPETTP